MQIPGVDYTGSFAPVASDTAIRLIIGMYLYYNNLYKSENWLLEAFDVEAAFLNTDLETKVYSRVDLHLIESPSQLFLLKEAPIHITTPTESTGSSPELTHKENPPFSWLPPDLAQGGKWYTLPEPEKTITQGKMMLEQHRSNYTKTHPDPTYRPIPIQHTSKSSLGNFPLNIGRLCG
jgi:hypothetical protein